MASSSIIGVLERERESWSSTTGVLGWESWSSTGVGQESWLSTIGVLGRESSDVLDWSVISRGLSLTMIAGIVVLAANGVEAVTASDNYDKFELYLLSQKKYIIKISNELTYFDFFCFDDY